MTDAEGYERLCGHVFDISKRAWFSKGRFRSGLDEALMSAIRAGENYQGMVRNIQEVRDAYTLPEGIRMPWGRVVKP